MKFILRIAGLFLPLVLTLSCTKETCKNESNLPDLIHEFVEINPISQNPNQNIYSVNFEITNSAESLACRNNNKACSSVLPAGRNIFAFFIYFNETTQTPLNWGAPIDSFLVQIPELSGCESINALGMIDFIKDGYYLIESKADFYNDVFERDEENNGNVNSGSNKYTPNSKNVIIIEQSPYSNDRHNISSDTLIELISLTLKKY